MIPVASPLASYQSAREDIDAAVSRVLASGTYILGSEVEALEDEFASYLEVPHAVAVANGTDGLALAMRALDVGPGDEVITVSHTAVATVAAIEQVGATPVLVDIMPGTYTLDFEAARNITTERTAAVIPVHIYGQSADLDAALAYRTDTGVPIIEDCAQAHGARWNGQRVGTLGDIGVFSCYPTKNLGALGDAGLIATASDALAERIRRIREYGWQERNSSIEPGVNSRLDEMQAAILRVQLARLDRQNARRAVIARRYSSAFSDLAMVAPSTRDGATHVFHLFVCEVDDRAAFQAHLNDRGVGSAIHYPNPVHVQPAYAGRVKHGPMPVTDRVRERIVSLPMFPELDDANVDRVIDAVRGFFS